jgi:UDP-glucuronate decarboxylase
MHIIDVRDLVDKAGNSTDFVLQKIVEGSESLRDGKKTVICCDYGISRSNAVAAGILAMHEGIPFESAVRRVVEATGERDIKIEPLQVVRSALGEDSRNFQSNRQRVLVTGGDGTLGMPVSQRLTEEFDVTTLGRGELDLQLGSTQLDLIVSEKQIGCIVHLANPRIFTSNNALGTTLTMLRNVLDVCVARNLKLIYISSFEVYSGYRSGGLVADESLPLLPRGPYGETKYLCEKLIEHSRSTQNLNCLMLRSSTVFGVGSDKPRFIYNFIEKINRSQRIVSHRYNNSLAALDLLYLDDFVMAVDKAVRSDFKGNLNIGSGVVTSTKKIAEILKTLLSSKSEIDTIQIDSDTACIAMDARNAQKVLNWHPKVDIENGLKLILLNYKLRKN